MRFFTEKALKIDTVKELYELVNGINRGNNCIQRYAYTGSSYSPS